MTISKIKVAKKKVDFVEKVPTVYDQARNWVEGHPYHLAAGLGVLVLVFAIYWGATAYSASRENSAGEAYSSLLKLWPQEGEISQGDVDKLLPELQKFVQERRGTKAALDAQLDLAQALYRAKRFEEAQKLARGVLDEAGVDSALATLARYQVAVISQATGQTDEAIRQWEALKAAGMPNLDREVNWSLAQLYAAKGDGAKAVEFYEAALKASGSYPPTPLLQNELASAKGTRSGQ